MNIYVAECIRDENLITTEIGVFSTIDKAKEACGSGLDWKGSLTAYTGYYPYVRYEIHEYVLDPEELERTFRELNI